VSFNGTALDGPAGQAGEASKSASQAMPWVTGRRAVALIGAACVLPRLAVLLYERGDILASFTEKSDEFANTFVESGT
jgi:hypothetical protein